MAGRMTMHNLSTVISFEILRTIKKKSFWIMALSFPVIISGIFAVVFFSNKATDEAAKNTEKQKFSIVIKDDSGKVSPAMIAAVGATTTSDKQAAIDSVKQGKTDAFFYYPAAIEKNKVEVYGKDVGLFDNGRYQGVATMLLTESVSQTVGSDVRAILQDHINYDAVMYKDGVQYDGFKQLIAPGIFLVLFYALIAMFGSQMLNSTIEEKENRVIEMILTTIEARTLIVGKIISLIALAIIQAVVILIPIITGYLLFKDKLSLPSLDLTNLPLDPTRILIGLILFAVCFMLFTGLLVTVGAASPTAKEASGFLGVVMMLLFGPLYAVTLFVSAPQSPIVQFLSYFPLTAPIPLLLRNAIGNLTVHEAIIAIVILTLSTIVVIRIAVSVFQYGALEYSRRLSLREIISKH